MDELNYSKISNQDIQIAEVFFENDKHLDEFLANVSRYYSKKPLTIKTKIVKKYFAAYTKTMNFVIQAREKGKVGGDKRAEIQANKNDTLQGGLDNPKTTLDDTQQPNINSKAISNNIKDNNNPPPENPLTDKNINSLNTKKETDGFGSVAVDAKFLEYVKTNFPTVAKLEMPNSEQVAKLKATYKFSSIEKTLKAMENKKALLKTYKSCILTLTNWLDRDNDSKIIFPVGETETERKIREFKARGF